MIRQEHMVRRIPIDSILYIEAVKERVNIHCRHYKEKNIIIWETLSSLEERTEALGFTRIHRSFLVNVAKVKDISEDRKTIRLDDKTTILPIARRRLKKFWQELSFYYGKM